MLLDKPVSDTMNRTTAEALVSPQARSRCQLKLWSDFSEICSFLKISMPPNMHRENIHFHHINCKAGQSIYKSGQPFSALYLVNSGVLKTVLLDEFGNEQVLNFPMSGDVIGLDSLFSDKYQFDVVALSDCNLILLPVKQLFSLSRNYVQIEQSIFELISKELVQQHIRLSMIGKTSAEARVAQFLVVLSEKFSALGYSKNEYHLRMTRNDLGSYLGITLETVSRILSSLNESGIISVHQKKICLKNIDELKNIYLLGKHTSRKTAQLLPV